MVQLFGRSFSLTIFYKTPENCILYFYNSGKHKIQKQEKLQTYLSKNAIENTHLYLLIYAKFYNIVWQNILLVYYFIARVYNKKRNKLIYCQ